MSPAAAAKRRAQPVAECVAVDPVDYITTATVSVNEACLLEPGDTHHNEVEYDDLAGEESD